MSESFDPMLIVERAESHLAAMRDANARNRLLAGDLLRHAAQGLISVADGFEVGAVDAAGERIIGAALAMSDRLTLRDETVRSDGKNVLLVSGFTAGDAGRARAVSQAWVGGAARIELAVMSPCLETPVHCDQVTVLGGDESMSLDLVAEFEAVGWDRTTSGPGYTRRWAPDVDILGESVVIPLDEAADDYAELRAEAIRALRVARATYFARTSTDVATS